MVIFFVEFVKRKRLIKNKLPSYLILKQSGISYNLEFNSNENKKSVIINLL
jgi:hypothetical protein